MIKANEFKKKIKKLKSGKPAEVKKEEEKKEPSMETPAINLIDITDVAELSIPKRDDDDVEVEVESLAIVLPYEVWFKMMTYTKLLDDEINGIGIVEREGGKFIVKDLFLLEQEVSGAQCDIKPDSMVNLMQEMVEADKGDDIPKLRFWWHSHNTMGVHWSSTDDATGKNFAGSEFLVSIVTNHRGEMRGKVNLYAPVDLAIDNVNITVQKPLPDANIVEQCKEDIRTHVKKEVFYRPPVTHTPYQCGFYGNMYGKFENDVEEEDNKKSPIIVPHQGKFNKAEQKELKVGPYGQCLVQNGVRAIWNFEKQLYVFEDTLTQHPVEEDEAIALLGFDINDSAFYSLD